MSVNLNEGADCKSDVFINDLISVGVDIEVNVQQLITAPCTAIMQLHTKLSQILISLEKKLLQVTKMMLKVLQRNSRIALLGYGIQRMTGCPSSTQVYCMVFASPIYH